MSTSKENGDRESSEEEMEVTLMNTFLRLDEIDSNLYRSTHLLRGRKDHNRVYGGQVVGQALMAAHRTVQPKMYAHSLHCNFIWPADADRPLIYEVNRIRDGRSFATRLVRAIQGGRPVFTTSISFQVVEPDSISHQTPMPDVPPPEDCEDQQDFVTRLLTDPSTVSPEGLLAAKAYRQVLDFPLSFRVKMVTPKDYISTPLDRPLKFALWVKSNSHIGNDYRANHAVAAFISDVAPIGTPIAAHAARGFPLGMAASLDHSMWIHHHDFRIDQDWMLYETESTIGAASRALIHGKMWTRDGRMVLSSSQEILVRGRLEGQRSTESLDGK